MSVATSILTHLAVNGLALLYCGATVLTGRAILKAMGASRFPESGGLVAVAAALTLGQGVLGVIWQGLAMLSLFYWWSVLLVLIAGTVLGFPGAMTRAAFAERLSRMDWRALASRNTDRAVMWFAAAACVLMAMFAPLSVLPPGADAMAFYVSQPKLIAAAHFFLPLPGYETFAQIGLASELHYAVFFSIGGDHIGELAGRLFIWILAAASLALAWGIGARLNLPKFGRWLLVILLLTSTAFTLLVWDGKTDLVPNGLALLAIYLLLAPTLLKGDVAAAGLASGLACAGKLSFIPSFGITIGLLLCFRIFALRDGQALRRLIGSGSRFAVWAVLPFIALMLKNGIVFGEPLAPFIMLKGGKAAALDQVWFNPENTAWIIKTYPLALAFGQYPMQHGNVSALLLVALPLLFWISRKKITTLPFQLAVAGLAGILAWVILRPSVLAPRYILPCLFALLPAAALLMSLYWRSSGRFGRGLLATAVASSMLITAVDAGALLVNNWRYLLRLPVTIANPIWQVADVANHSKRPDVRVFNMMYYSSMYRSDLAACMLAFDDDILKRFPTISEYWGWMYTQGITNVSYDRLTHESRLPWPLDPEKTPRWLEVKEIRIDDRFRAYELHPKNDAPQVSSRCESAVFSKK